MLPNPGPYLALFGFMVAVSPLIVILRKYGPDPETAVDRWLSEEPLESWLRARSMVISGGGMLVMGLMLWAARP